ncbi:F-box domain, cyclin-like protein [Artemisia annua]|uniref:F-box domain, cyclin-like protein n=1 Tax=Artemisia annua TaxID=35608 RepID=A0A2U1M2U3_ARTAN|nr:F-box domain, cyclin-like protein [Artemisia annua]
MSRSGRLSWLMFLNSKNYNLDPQDTISTLPEDVIHHIISFLETEDKEQLRLLSRKWRLVHSQTQKYLCFSECFSLDEQQISTIIQDYFPSAESLVLEDCSEIKNLKIANNKLTHIIVCKCEDLEKVELSTPNLQHLYFYGAVRQPCVFELIDTTKLKKLMFDGEYIIDDNTFLDCDKTFPVLEDLTLGCSYYMPHHLKISSRSLKNISLFDLKKPVDITIDAEALVCIQYKDHLIHNFSNSNIPNVQNAIIEFNTHTNQEPDDSWFQKVVGMLQAFKPSDTLLLKVESDKSLVIPEEARRSLFPPISVGPETLTVEIDKATESVADLLDFIFWISPRAEDVTICRESAVISIQMKHGEISGISQNHSCCASFLEKCWRHSLEEVRLMCEFDESKGR